MMLRDARHHRTCTVTQPPATGEVGVTTIASNLPCSNPWPASKATRELPDLASIVELFEMTADSAAFAFDQTVTLDDGREFKIKRAMPWDSSQVGRDTFYFLVVEMMVT